MYSPRTVLFALLCAAFAVAKGQEKIATAPAPAAAPVPPPAVLTWGGDLRLRNEYFDNGLTLNDVAANHEQDYFRTRARLWAVYTPESDLTLNTRIAAEPRNWVRPAYVKQHVGDGPEWRYVIADCLNVKGTTAVADMPVTVTVGRQDIQFGDPGNAWLVYDGTPAEGSWTTFFDAARVALNAKPIKTQFDVIFLNQQAHPSDHLPLLGYPSTYTIAEQDEKAVILYASNKSIEKTQVDGYFIYKNDTAVTAAGDTGEIYTLGSKWSGTPTANWAYSVEGAYQWGRKKDPGVKIPVPANTSARDIAAYGGNARLTYLFKDKLNNQLSLVSEYLSGDKPGTTGKDEMFDILWGRYPRWSEVGANTFSIETGGRNAQYNNLIRVGPNWTVAPIKTMSVSFTYNSLFAPEAVPTRATNVTLFSESGHFRGHYFQAFVRQAFTKQISGLLFGEAYFQGDFYSHRELMTFARAELMFTF
jgi:hypothetical protein